MSTNGQQNLTSLVDALRGLRCWYVSCAGSAGSTFQLALGAKVPRKIPVKNPAHSEEYRRYEGESNVLVWCSWRLDGPDRPLTSSDDSEEAVTRELGQLVGASVESACVTEPAWDLTLRFSNELCLHVFCDHLPGDPSFDGNWDLWGREWTAFVGPGAACTVQLRAQSEAEPSQ